MNEIKKQFIQDIQAGDIVSSSFLVTRKESRKGKNDKNYIDIELQDNTGKVPAKIWNDSISKTEPFAKKDVVFIEGKVEDNYGKQINVKSLKKITSKDIDYSQYDFKSRKVEPEYIENMVSYLKDIISGMENIFLKKLLEKFFGEPDFLKKFALSTAAIKNHHALEGGLLMHTVSMVKLCDFVVGFYDNNVDRQRIDRDLVVTGAILHDIGKTIGYSVENFLDINDEESLISHVNIGYGMVLEKINSIKGFPEKTRQELLHIILSHHGAKEFGAPVEPQTLEAIIIYNIDRLDADIDHYFTLAQESIDSDVFQYSNYFKRKIFIRKDNSLDEGNRIKSHKKESDKDFRQDSLL